MKLGIGDSSVERDTSDDKFKDENEGLGQTGRSHHQPAIVYVKAFQISFANDRIVWLNVKETQTDLRPSIAHKIAEFLSVNRTRVHLLLR